MPDTTVAANSTATRSDAVANREQILQTAARIVKRRGAQVPMAQFAEAAGVGVGTLYRHFPSREDLIGALQLRAFEFILDAARDAAASEASACEALARFFHGVIARRDEIVLPFHGGPPIRDPQTHGLQAEVETALRTVLRRGQEEETIRADVAPFDVIVTAAMLSQPLPHVANWELVAGRQVRVYLDGLSGSCVAAP